MSYLTIIDNALKSKRHPCDKFIFNRSDWRLASLLSAGCDGRGKGTYALGTCRELMGKTQGGKDEFHREYLQTHLEQ